LRLDREENAVPGRADRSRLRQREFEEFVRPRSNQLAVVLGRVKAKPDGGR
jgi:hypothetical protein